MVVAHADGEMQRALARALTVALALLTAASFGILLSRTLEMSGGVWPALLPDMWLALTVTHFGHIWWWRIPALALLWLTCGWTWRRKGQGWTVWIMALALATIAITRSDTGHPADNGDFTLAVWADWLHLLAAGAWVGSLFGTSLVVFPHLLRMGERANTSAAAIFQRLSTLSGIALAGLLAGGIYNAVQQLGAFASLWTTRYGVILDIKIAIVLVMIAIGAHNRYIKLPRLLRTAAARAQPTKFDAVRTCARAVLAESLLGIAVIGAAACLIHSMPPVDVRALPAAMQASTPHAPVPETAGLIVAFAGIR